MIKATNLSKSFKNPQIDAIKNLSFEIKKGEITGLVGPDGAGKSTLLRMCAGLLKPSSGSLEVMGHSMPCADFGFLHDTSYMPQLFGLYSDLSCLENLNLYAKLQGLQNPKKRIDELLDFTNLMKFKDRMAGSLSGGMKQKLAFGAALLKKPKLLLLDEPGVGVDPISRKEIWAMARSLEEISIFWATSYMDEARQCDSVILLNEGEIIFNDRPNLIDDLMQNRVFLVSFDGDKREFLTTILEHENVLDAYLVGSKIRVVLRNKFDINSSFKMAKFEPVQASFEDAFTYMLGIKTVAHSQLLGVLNKAEEMQGNSLEARNLCKNFGKFKAASDISFSVERGEIFGFLGPNGAGKSTTFKMICGLLKPSSGSSFVCGEDISKSKNKIGYMAQKFSLYANLGLLDNLEFFAGIYGLQGKKKDEILNSMIEIFGLKKYAKNKVGELPLGIKQRLALSCSLMHSPAVLFLDEATSGVDPITRKEFWRHINAVSKLGISVMVTTHLMDEAEFCDRVMLIDAGKMIAIGSPDELKQKANCSNMEDAFIALVKEARGEF
ncbi:ABC transporter, ATP-binding protein [Campylobacter iguaniorum]|uniref:ATP-binding cassette domain-containing protein n=1 Tax=Campylobacter iguaniorum TaxID=1244531 RepID=UPI0007C8F094|nr:ATP-binding cassette domain-containing protein [Campylobacter iguaniorum]ANE35310.1 ABC transporter, ATP-binding protein [Campylobacter iguaniorum]